MIKVKRVYEKPDKSDGFRILIDRLWPRGLSKERGSVDLWLKDMAPSNTLRKWFAHDQKKWTEFKRRYFEELKDKDKLIDLVLDKAQKGSMSLLYGARDKKFNNAIALKEYIDDLGR